MVERRTSASPASSRATADCDVPMRAATSVWDRPSRCRARTRSLIIRTRRSAISAKPGNTDRRLAIAVMISRTRYRSGGRERAWKMLDAVDEARAQPVGLARGLDVGHAPEQLAEHHRDLPPGQMGAEAEVGAGTAEADVRVGLAA